MTNRYECEDKQRLVAYLYGEAGREERKAIDAHLETCAPCADELRELRDVRTTLSAWEPPATELGFRVVREPEAAPPARRWWSMPAWAPVAVAAGLLLALAASVEVEYGGGVVTVRTGWARAASAPAAPAPVEAAAPAGVTEGELAAALEAFESKLRAQLAAAPREATPAAPVRAEAAAVDRSALLGQVVQLIEASERRQQRELAFRLAQVVQDMDAQRRTDLVRIENGLGQIEGVTGQEVAQQRQLINYLMRTSQQR